MKKIIAILVVLIVSYATISSINKSYITDYNPIIERSGGPALILGLDKTGGPVSSGTCTQCHGASNGSTSIAITVKDFNSLPVSEYIPGASYTMEFAITNGSMSSFGMQAVALNSSNAQAGSYGNPISGNTQVTALNSREYVEHSSVVTNAGGFTYIVPWTAPNVGTGSVNVYGMGMAVNGNFSTGGDLPSTPTSIILTEFIPTTISYTSINYCENENNQTPIVTGNQTGIFTSTAGLVISPATGVIDISNSTIGNYVVTYTYDGSLTVTVNVSINEIYNGVDNVTICGNESYIFGSQTLTSADAGLNTEVFQSISGCDSTIILTLSVLPNTFETTVTICDDESYIFGSQTLSSSDVGLNTEVFPNGMANGCDSVVNLTLSIQVIDNSVTSTNDGVLMASQNGATYQWLDCNNGNIAITDSINQTYTVDPGGSTPYNCAVEITLNGCTTTSNCIEAIFFGIDEYTSSILSVYPNPTNESFTIKGLNKITDIKFAYIMDINGEVVLEIIDVYSKIEVDQLSSGIYYLLIEHGNEIEQLKIVKQ